MKTKTKLTPNLINNFEYKLDVKAEIYGTLYYQIVSHFPDEICYENIDAQLLQEKIFDLFPDSRNEEITNMRYSTKTNSIHLYTAFYPITNDIFLEINSDDFPISLNAEIYFHKDTSNLLVLEKLKTFLISCIIKEKSGKINLMTYENNKFKLNSYDLKNNVVDINENYNDDFIEHSNKIIKYLCSDENTSESIVLTGDPGVGKSFYLKHILASCSCSRPFIFVTGELVQKIASPEFLGFLLSNKNAVLIIEDFDSVITHKNQYKDVILNLKNLTSGILGSCLNITILMTFNSDNNIVNSVLADLKIFDSYDFKKLSAQKSKKLIDKLGYSSEKMEEMTLADIYNFGEINNAKEEKKIGF